MKLEAIERYRDLELDQIKEPGETFETSEARGKRLIRKGFAREVKKIKAKEGPEKR